MRSPNVLQPILAAIGDDSEYPGVKTPPNFAEMLIGFNKGRLEYVFRHIRTSGHSKCMAVQRIAVSAYQYPERVLVTSKNLGNNLLIGVDGRHLSIWCRPSPAQRLTALILQRH